MGDNIIFKGSKKYEFYTFSKENLHKALDNEIYPKEKILKSRLFSYLYEYFTYESEQKSQAKIIVVEKEYISESYLDDLRLFYWSNFKNYDKFCRRLHFFSISVSKKELERKVLDRDTDFFKDSYLGYIVVKPTGNSLLGPTFLKTYGKSENFDRKYNSTVEMSVSLFGIEIPIEGLVFQEQDGAVGVCATQAIWSAMNKLSSLFRIDMITPSAISSYGGIGTSGRIFPNSGLSNEQIFKIFRKAGLTVELMSLSHVDKHKMSKSLFKQIVYAYNKIGIPILLGYTGRKKSGEKSPEELRHLVTVVGFRLDVEKEKEERKKEKRKIPSYAVKTVAEDIYRLYVHNDQIGPYTKIGFDEKPTNS
jgi:hypothetical protein